MECTKCGYTYTLIGKSNFLHRKWFCDGCKDPDSWYVYQMGHSVHPNNERFWSSPVRDAYWKLDGILSPEWE